MHDQLRQLLTRARRCRRTAFAAPVFTDIAETQAIMRGVTACLAQVTEEDERLLCFAALGEIQAVLEASTERLRTEMAATAEEMRRAWREDRVRAAAQPSEGCVLH